MPATIKTDSPRTHTGDSSFVSIVSGWAQQGVQTFFATQRILLDLAMRQNANVMHALRQQLTDPHHSPTAILSEVAGEGMTNFLEGQKILLDLGKQQNEILMSGVKERIGDSPAAQAMTDLLRRSVDTFIRMQEEFLKIAGRQLGLTCVDYGLLPENPEALAVASKPSESSPDRARAEGRDHHDALLDLLRRPHPCRIVGGAEIEAEGNGAGNDVARLCRRRGRFRPTR